MKLLPTIIVDVLLILFILPGWAIYTWGVIFEMIKISGTGFEKRKPVFEQYIKTNRISFFKFMIKSEPQN
jgi:hypothetical protein